jgi:transposase
VCFRLFPDTAVNTDITISFLRTLLRHTKRPIILIWDRLHAHVSLRTRRFLDENRTRLGAYLLPPYAPEVNPVEQIWGYLKMNPMANHPIHDTASLASQARKHARSVQMRPTLLQSFLDHTPLSFWSR